MTGVSTAFERHLLVAVDAVGYGRGTSTEAIASALQDSYTGR